MPTPLDYATRRRLQRTPIQKQAAPVQPLRKAAELPPPAYAELLLQGNALFHTGQAGSAWEGMGMVASSQPALYAAYVEECRQAHGQPDARLIKAMAALVPPPNATEALMQAIATRQAAEPGLSFVQASDVVRKHQPQLYDAYVWESHHPGQPQPVTTQAALTPETVIKTARTLADDNTTSCRAELLTLLKAAEGTPHFGAVWEAWRWYQTSNNGVDDWYAEHLATGTPS